MIRKGLLSSKETLNNSILNSKGLDQYRFSEILSVIEEEDKNAYLEIRIMEKIRVGLGLSLGLGGWGLGVGVGFGFGVGVGGWGWVWVWG
jgi:hypothetical protein